VRILRPSRDVPFAVDAADGWRAWSVIEQDEDVWLSSLTRAEEWQPAMPFVATCARRRHPSPHRGCSCGIYAAAKPEELAGLGRIAGAAIGQVSLWGRLAEHSRGYRAEIAYPARLRLVCVACLAEGNGVLATRIDRLSASPASPRVRLVPMCEVHADIRSLPPAREVEQRLLARYRVEALPDASIARVRRDPRIALAEQRSSRRVLAIAAVTLSFLTLVALVGGLARGRPTATQPSIPAAGPPVPVRDDSIKLPHDRISTGLVSAPGIRVLLLSPRAFIAPQCGKMVRHDVVTAECGDPRADVFVENAGSAGARRGGTCSNRTKIVTRRGDRILCWRGLPRS